MNYLLLYFLVGAIVAVWTAINNLSEPGAELNEPRRSSSSFVAACALVGLAWPVAVGIFVYSILTALLGGTDPQDEY